MKKKENENKIIHSKGGDENLIIPKWKEAYSRRFKYMYPERWEWVLYQNPFSNDQSNSIPLWIAFEKDKVAGWVTAMDNIIEINSKPYTAGVGADLYVLPNYRGKGIATNLLSSLFDYYDVFFGINFAEIPRKIGYKKGAIQGKPFHMYYKLIKSLNAEKLCESFLTSFKKRIGLKNDLLNQNIKNIGIFYILSNFLSRLLKNRQNRHGYKKIISNPQLSFEKIDFFNHEADKLWDRCKNRYSLSVRRDSRYLNWKYVEQPHLKYQNYYIRLDNQIYGILIHRLGTSPEIPVGIITEIFTEDDNVENLLSILNFSENQLTNQGAEIIRCGTSIPSLKFCLEHSSFQHIETYQPAIFLSDNLKNEKNNLLNGKWLMSMGDQDIDIPLKNGQPDFTHILSILIGKIRGN